MKQLLEVGARAEGRAWASEIGVSQVISGLVLLVLLCGSHWAVAAEESGAPNASVRNSAASVQNNANNVVVEALEPLPVEELPALVGPIALYPDDLLSIVLAAATYPLQVVQASRFLQERERDPELKPAEEWDDAVVALLNYPEALALLNDDLDWTWKLGQAVLVQQEEVLTAVGEFRERARVAGNLDSDEKQLVEVADDGAIAIKPADPEVIYVPYYEPSRVTVYHDYPVYHYYPRAYPVYYYPYPAGYRFSTGYFWGVTSAFSIGWSSLRLHQHHHSFYGHPYYGRTYYYDDYYYRRPHLSATYNYYRNYDRYRHSNRRHHAGNYWRPRTRYHGSSPRYSHRSGNRAHRDFDRKHRGDFDRKYRGARRDRSAGYNARRSETNRPRREVARQPVADAATSESRRRGAGHRERRQRPAATRRQSPERGSRSPTRSREGGSDALAGRRALPQPQRAGSRGVTQGSVPRVASTPNRGAAQQRPPSQAPRRDRESRHGGKTVTPFGTIDLRHAERVAHARSAPSRVQRKAPAQRPGASSSRSGRSERGNARQQARSAPQRVQRGASMQARAQRQANAYAARSAAPKRHAPKARRNAPNVSKAPKAQRSMQRSTKAQGSGHRGSNRANRSSGNRSGRRASFSRN